MPIGVVGVGVVAAVGIGRAGHAPEIVVGGGCGDAGDGLARLWGQVGHGHARRLIQRVVLDLLLRRDVAAGGGIRTVPLLITGAAQRIVKIDDHMAVGVLYRAPMIPVGIGACHLVEAVVMTGRDRQ